MTNFLNYESLLQTADLLEKYRAAEQQMHGIAYCDQCGGAHRIYTPVGKTIYASECAVCDAVRFKCNCGGKVEYHQWDAVDPYTGDHMGIYRVFACETCGTEVDVS